MLDGINLSSNSVVFGTVTGNVCRSNGGDGIRSSFAHYVTISDNVCINNSVSSNAVNDFNHGIRIQGDSVVIASGNVSTDTATNTNGKTQQDGIRVVGSSNMSVLLSHNFLSSNSRRAITLTGTPAAFVKIGNVESSHSILFPGTSQVTDGTAAAPAYTFLSEFTLGLYRSGVDTIAQSQGTFNLATNAVRLSMRTLGASASSTNMSVNEVLFSVNGASGASLAIRSGGTIWIFNSSVSTVG